MDKNKEYTNQLEQVIKNMLKSLSDVPFSLIMDELSGHKVFNFDNKNKTHLELLEQLKIVATKTIKMVDDNGGIYTKRANEVGIIIEKYIKDAFRDRGLNADTPRNTAGKKQSAGYPDIQFEYQDNHYYLECKTYNKESLGTTFRAFYLSPSEKPKITIDTIHFMMSFEIEKRDNHFFAINYKIISLENLELDVKYEFNSSNKKMYSNKNGAKILYESKR